MGPLGTAPTFPADALTHALAGIPAGAWGETSTLEQSGTHHGYRTVSLVEPGRWQPLSDQFAFVLHRFAPVYQAWLSWLEPGGYILPHVDAGPYHDRWQVPIVPAGTMNDAAATAGAPFRVRHWEPHSVSNETSGPRIHLLIDRAVVVDDRPVLFRRT